MKTSQSQFLVQIQKQRLTLERLIAIARDMERMNHGLNAVLQLDNISFEITEEIQSFLTLITDNIKDASTNDATELLKSLDHRVHKSLEKVMNKALIEISRDMDNEEIETNSRECSSLSGVYFNSFLKILSYEKILFNCYCIGLSFVF